MPSALDRYEFRDSPVHRLDPRVKLLATVGFAVGNVLLPDGAWLAFGLALAGTIAVGTTARLGAGFALRRSFVALPFMLAGASVLFATPGTPLAQWQVGGNLWTITDVALVRFLSLLLRTWLSVQGAILLTATTTFPDIAHALRHLGVPPVLVAILSFMYRYLFVLADEAQRLLRARTARSAALPGQRAGGSLPWRARVAGGMAGQLLVRSMERGDRVYLAMVARGYRGELLTMNRHTMQPRDWRAAALVALVLAGLQLVGRA